MGEPLQPDRDSRLDSTPIMYAFLRTMLMAPVWAAQLVTGAKSFIDNPIIGSPWLNRHGLHVARMRLAHLLADFRRLQLAYTVAPADRAAFARDGFLVKPDFMPPALFSAMRSEIASYRCAVREMVQGDTITRHIALDDSALSHLPATRELLDGRDWRRLIRYVGASSAEPIHYIQSILTQVRPDQPDPQLDLHSDTFHPTVKAWLFLDDVAEDGAPFTYVPGSHRPTRKRLDWERRMSIAAAATLSTADTSDRLTGRGSFRIDEAELAGIGLPPPRRFAVSANTLIIADTAGFHARGASAQPSRRVEIWAYGRSSPFVPWAGIDLWRLSGLGRRRAGWFWGWADGIERAGGRHALWRERKGLTAYDPV